MATKERRANTTEKARRPRGGNGTGGFSKRADGSWQFVRTFEGRRVYGYGATQEKARQSCLNKIALREAGLDRQTAEQTTAQWLAWWLENVVSGRVASRTEKSYRDTCRLHLIPTLGGTSLRKLTVQHVETLLRQKERDGLGPRSVALIREILRASLNAAMKRGIVERNVAALADGPRQGVTKRRVLSADEAKRLLAATATNRLGALYAVALATGMRQGEMLALRWDDVDLDAGVLRVEHSLCRLAGVLEMKAPKTPRSRRAIKLPASTVAALRKHRDVQAFERAKAGDHWQDAWNLVFSSTIGTPLDARNLTRGFKAHLAAAGLPDDLRFYDLRHAAASLMVSAGVPISIVADRLGHSTPTMTLNRYSHALPEIDLSAADAMERLLA